MGALALLVFLLVALIASLVVREIQRDGRLLAGDTIPGLVYAGEALNRMSDNWMTVQLLVNADQPSTRAALIKKIDGNSTVAAWQNYQAAISDPRDKSLFDELTTRRQDFFNKRKRFFELVKAGRLEEVSSFFDSQLKPSFDTYRKSAINIFSFNVAVGKARARDLIQLSRWTPYALAGFCAVVFLAGILIGFKASLGAFSGGWSDKARA